MTMATATTTQTTVYSAWDELPNAGDGGGRGPDASENSEELFEDLGRAGPGSEETRIRTNKRMGPSGCCQSSCETG